MKGRPGWCGTPELRLRNPGEPGNRLTTHDCQECLILFQCQGLFHFTTPNNSNNDRPSSQGGCRRSTVGTLHSLTHSTQQAALRLHPPPTFLGLPNPAVFGHSDYSIIILLQLFWHHVDARVSHIPVVIPRKVTDPILHIL